MTGRVLGVGLLCGLLGVVVGCGKPSTAAYAKRLEGEIAKAKVRSPDLTIGTPGELTIERSPGPSSGYAASAWADAQLRCQRDDGELSFELRLQLHHEYRDGTWSPKSVSTTVISASVRDDRSQNGSLTSFAESVTSQYYQYPLLEAIENLCSYV